MTVACHAPGTAWEGAPVAGGPCRWWQVWVLRFCSCVPRRAPCVRVSKRVRGSALLLRLEHFLGPPGTCLLFWAGT